MVNTTSRAFGSPSRYIQGPGEFKNLKEYVRQYNGTVVLLIDAFLFDTISSQLVNDFADSGMTYHAEKFGGECCEPEVNRVAQIAEQLEAKVMVGVGGGKTLDTTKLVAANLNIATVIVPTSASTDAPTSALSVLYKETGEHLKYICHSRTSDLILVDSEIIAKAPVRLFVAGMGDALSTWFEARANYNSDTANYIGNGYRRTKAGMAIAKMCFDILMEDGPRAKLALEQGIVSEAVENVIEANILLSGLGFENTGCAGAHAMQGGFSEIPEAHKFYHGEIVAFGVIFQLALENVPTAEFEQVLQFCKTIGLPVTLKQLNVEPTAENIQKITDQVVDGNSGVEAEPFLVTRERVQNAIASANVIGTEFLNR